MKDIQHHISKFEKRAKIQDARTDNMQKTVDNYTLSFTNKIDRLIKDFGLRFSDFTKFTNHLKHLSTNVDYLKNCQ